MKRAIIFSNGNLSDIKRVKNIIFKKDFIICADGSVKKVLKIGLMPHIVIGDFDSTPKFLRKKLAQLKIDQIKYPKKKNKTDFELVIDFLLKKKFRQVIIFGLFGERIDHFMANLLLLAKIQKENPSIKIKIIEGNKEMFIMNEKTSISGQIGEEISLIPLEKNLTGVKTEGLEYPLNNEALFFGSTRGISNVMTKNLAEITAKNGSALVVHRLKLKRALK